MQDETMSPDEKQRAKRQQDGIYFLNIMIMLTPVAILVLIVKEILKFF